jgi:hypothetical protein
MIAKSEESGVCSNGISRFARNEEELSHEDNANMITAKRIYICVFIIN